jgi:hypothetical protein
MCPKISRIRKYAPAKGKIEKQAMSEWKPDSAIIRFAGLMVDDGVFDLKTPPQWCRSGSTLATRQEHPTHHTRQAFARTV